MLLHILSSFIFVITLIISAVTLQDAVETHKPWNDKSYIIVGSLIILIVSIVALSIFVTFLIT